jgi:hypothetical protein
MLELHQDGLKKLKGIGLEIDLPGVVDNLRWAVSNLVYLGRTAKDPEDKDNYFNQIEAITDSITWICTISDISGLIEDASKEKGGESC